jgi:hypothetical protein
MLVAMWRLLWAGVFCAFLAFGQGKGAGKANPRKHDNPPAKAAKQTYPAFRDAEIRILLDFYRPGSGHLPPGIARKGEFPPGIMKQLARGKGLPPGLAAKLEPLPEPLARQFPPPPPGYRRALCGNFALLLEDSTLLVVDIVNLAP